MKIAKKLALLAVSVGVLTFGATGAASAHVTVKPNDVKTGTYQTFTINAPVERSGSMVSVKVDIPEALTDVTPTIKPGWTVQVEKHTEGETVMTTAITWAGGKVDLGYRDEFTFSAKVPDQAIDLQWKAYQTYQDGTVVMYDQQPGSDDNKEGGITGPFSVTKVAASSDQDTALKNADAKAQNAQTMANRALYVAIGGSALALIAVILLIMRRPKDVV